MLFKKFIESNILVIGDLILDEYWHGFSERMSPEAPVPVVNLNSKEHRIGGAGNVALNIVSLNSNAQYFAAPDGAAPGVAEFNRSTNEDSPADTFSVIGDTNGGRYGTRFAFRMLAADNIQTSDVLFNKLGNTTVSNYVNSGAVFKYIDSTIRITGFTTGYRVDIPVRFVKKTS